MKNIKDITLSIFAVIGFVAILSSFTQEVVYTEKQISNGTPESHELEFGEDGEDSYLFNKVTGEIRILSGLAIKSKKEGGYRVLKPID